MYEINPFTQRYQNLFYALRPAKTNTYVYATHSLYISSDSLERFDNNTEKMYNTILNINTIIIRGTLKLLISPF